MTVPQPCLQGACQGSKIRRSPCSPLRMAWGRKDQRDKLRFWSGQVESNPSSALQPITTLGKWLAHLSL